ncbi:ring finger protein 122 [Columba livia]|uniref:RING finger protein 122 n=3 Tax=Neoaves TaxID=3078114 RepID=A0A2I0LR02_COLLI|nr:ring finger protein 122 [Columba livia]
MSRVPLQPPLLVLSPPQRGQNQTDPTWDPVLVQFCRPQISSSHEKQAEDFMSASQRDTVAQADVSCTHGFAGEGDVVTVVLNVLPHSPSASPSAEDEPATCHFWLPGSNDRCSCSLGLIYTSKPCTMPPITFQDLPLNIYMVIFGTGIFVFVLSLIFCCYFISKLRHQAQSERFGYKEVVLKGDARRLNVHGQTCAVCLEDFKVKEELGVLPCQHAFHRKCLVKWLEVRCVCPMCNKPMAGPAQPRAGIGTLLDELV